MQTLIKHKSQIFKNNILGNFIIPFFSISLFIGIIGIILLMNNLINKLTSIYLTSKFNDINAAKYLINSELITLPPTVLFYFSISLLSLGLFFTFFSISNMKELNLRFSEGFTVLFYFLAYLSLYPFVILSSVYKFVRGNYTW